MRDFTGERLLRWARVWMDEDVVRDVIEPAVADVRHECGAHTSESGRRREMRRGQAIFLRTVVVAWWLGAQRRMGRAPWWVFLAPVSVILLGWATLVPLEAHKASHHVLFGLVGTAGALALALAPVCPPPRRVAWLAIPVIAALAYVAVFGVSFEGARRWVVLPSLTLHVAALLTPVFAAIVLAWRGGRLRVAFVGACCLALALQPNPAMGLLWGAIAVAASQRRQRSWAIGVSALALAMTVLTGGSMISESPIDVPLLVGTYNPIWATLTVAALGAPAAFAWWRRRGLSGEGRARASTFAIALTLWPMLATLGEGLVLLSYGGSMMVAYLLMVGMLLRDAASWPPCVGSQLG